MTDAISGLTLGDDSVAHLQDPSQQDTLQGGDSDENFATPGSRERRLQGGLVMQLPNHGQCPNPFHRLEGHTFKQMTVDSSAHLTPNIFGLIMGTAGAGFTRNNPLTTPLPIDTDHLIRVRYFADPYFDSAMYTKCALPHFSPIRNYVLCALHGLMAHVRGALKLTMIYILNQSKDKARHESAKALQGTPANRVHQFNDRFAKYGVGIFSETQGSSNYSAPAAKGPPSSNILRDMGESITMTENPTSGEPEFEFDPCKYPLKDIDEQQDTLRLWYYMHKVFTIAKMHAPSHADIARYSDFCFHLKVAWRLRGSNEFCVPYYIHLICDHSPSMLERWGSLWLFSNNISESYNKVLNQAWKHTTRMGANGRYNEAKVIDSLATGQEYRGKRGLRTGTTDSDGLWSAAKRLILCYSFTYKDEIDSLRQEWKEEGTLVLQSSSTIQRFLTRYHARASYTLMRQSASAGASAPCL
jgi:hypothetical protein